MKKTYLLLLGVIIFNFSVIVNAEATAVSFTDAWADWDSLTILIGVEDTDYTWSESGKSSNALARTSTDIIPQSQDGPYTIASWGSISATKDITDAKGYAYTTPELIAAESFATSDGITNAIASAHGETHRRGFFEMLTDSDLIFQVPWSYSGDISTSLPGEYAWAESAARLSLWGEGDEEGVFDNQLQWGYYRGRANTVQDGSSAHFEDDSSMAYVAYSGFEAGKTYAFNLRITSSSYVEGLPGDNVVPEPTSMLLFGTGLAGLGLFRRKKRR